MKKPRKKGGREKERAEVAAHLNVLHVLAMLAKLHVAGAGMLHFEDAGDGDGDGGLSIEIMALQVQEKW